MRDKAGEQILAAWIGRQKLRDEVSLGARVTAMTEVTKRRIDVTVACQYAVDIIRVSERRSQQMHSLSTVGLS